MRQSGRATVLYAVRFDRMTVADQILALLGVRIRSGELVVHYADGLVQKCETRCVSFNRDQWMPGRSARSALASGWLRDQTRSRGY